MDLAWLQKLIDMVDGSDLDSLEISKGFGTRIRLSKSPTVHVVAGSSAERVSGAAIPAVRDPTESAGSGPAAGSAAPPRVAPGDESVAPSASTLLEITSPMVGTFYRAPAPDAPPYVETGDRVTEGQTVCILEAMKLMNELESEVAGTVREICVQNGDPVEYGQVLFRIEPD
ncbi:MAG: acetyl-CoA carboxylase biotin carboxyl carrier protein [marine benthic group bacterium]|nr:acetyl-CoA carboxylase biotin carboxyl carrier protein [Gemmatimonadota bacterium]MCL7962324.1 acetyl-CoA carboxylase biotin carboxyl carrier protein [Candidatus Carthagonibacter metallireducens]MCL7937119.1 acetyl-CoA carboxylase biotin carboxyl carrier protein [Gemmatimonadota bacterium]MCL7957806.1 acetyl-CoA carboxylase biotin carboxyl carrier protein [Gemmatimonadota bacterium]MCL7965357.1 acetyl-CoA carboxylase biotin carboxyl carrier protein [Gemmatimonadota bacterium]